MSIPMPARSRSSRSRLGRSPEAANRLAYGVRASRHQATQRWLPWPRLLAGRAAQCVHDALLPGPRAEG
eukprot:scaffold241700_cov28-Tisochrysis_lutea.AAC.3